MRKNGKFGEGISMAGHPCLVEQKVFPGRLTQESSRAPHSAAHPQFIIPYSRRPNHRDPKTPRICRPNVVPKTAPDAAIT